jgi:hypothetical protein
MTEQDDTMAAAETSSPRGATSDKTSSPRGADPHTQSSASGADAETTWVPADAATVDAYAWSEGDEPADTERHPWTHTWSQVAIILSCGAVLGGAVLWLSGVSSKDAQPRSQLTVTAAPPPPVTITVTPAPPTPTAAQDEQFWQLFRQDVQMDPSYPRDWAIRLGHSVCPEMEGLHLAGYQVEDQISHIWAIPASTAVAIHGAAVTAYCPQLMGQ